MQLKVTELFLYADVELNAETRAGGIPRTVNICGRTLANELLLTGRLISALEARDRFHLLNAVVGKLHLLFTPDLTYQ